MSRYRVVGRYVNGRRVRRPDNCASNVRIDSASSVGFKHRRQAGRPYRSF